MSQEPLLRVQDLSIDAVLPSGRRRLVRGASFNVAPGEAVAIVGESGSGKTLTALTIMGLLRSANLQVTEGVVEFDGTDLRAGDAETVRTMRGQDISMIYQDPMTSLNPLMRVGKQLTEVMTTRGVREDEAIQRAKEGLIRVGIPDPDRAMVSYPHQFSGGMRQRVMIALALVMSPKLLIADEPTTALDVTIQQQILALVQGEQSSRNMGLVWITHDLGVVAQLVDRIIVMYNGSIVESGNRVDIFSRPSHPYTKALIGSIPDADPEHRERLVGLPMDSTNAPEGACPFMPRCDRATDACNLMPLTLSLSPDHEVACHNLEVSPL